MAFRNEGTVGVAGELPEVVVFNHENMGIVGQQVSQRCGASFRNDGARWVLRPRGDDQCTDPLIESSAAAANGEALSVYGHGNGSIAGGLGGSCGGQQGGLFESD